jgi:hypothetical protein
MGKYQLVLCALTSLTISWTAIAVPGQGVCFDPTYPEDFIDTRSIVHIDKSVVRFWERAGGYPNGDGPDLKFPQYTMAAMTEINCATHVSRDLRWEMALEAETNPAGSPVIEIWPETNQYRLMQAKAGEILRCNMSHPFCYLAIQCLRHGSGRPSSGAVNGKSLLWCSRTFQM